MMQNRKKHKVLNALKDLKVHNVVVLIATAVAAQAQETIGSYRLSDATQLWRLTDNAAGLGIDTTRNRGYAQIGVEHHSGDYHRVQEAQRTNQLRFYTERYQKVGKYLYGYGKFNFDYGRMNDRAWCDVQRAYNADPYFSGSAIKGKYDFQNFNFTAALASVKIKNHWNFGMKLDYNVGDLSRLRDPRPRSLTLDYKITPAVTYSFGRNTFGLSGNYHRRKEKISGVETIQTEATITYYDMTGMEHALGTVSGYSGYKREWVDHRFGAEITYGYNNRETINNNRGYNLLVAASIERGAEDVLGQYKRQYGEYVDYKYGLTVMNRIRSGSLLHEADIKVGYEQAYADEYKQKYYSENNDEKQIRTFQYTVRRADGTLETRDSTITKTMPYTSLYYETQMILKKRYQVKVFDLDLHYRLNFLDESTSLTSYVGLRFAMQEVSNKYLLPTSTLRYNRFDTTLEGGGSLLKGRLWIDGALTYRGIGKARQSLDDPTTDYAVQVLIPDMDYYGAKFFKGSLAVTYNFPIRIKGKTTSWYVRANGDWLKTNTHHHAASAALTLGMFN